MRTEPPETGAAAVDFYFSPGSRYCYLAASQIASLEADTGCRFRWRPVDGPSLRALRGADPFAGPPVSGQYDWDYRRTDAERWAAHYGIAFREPPSHEFDFRLLVRAATAGCRLGAGAEVGLGLCRAVYAEGAWPVDAALCARVAAARGLDESAFRACLADPETDRVLDAAVREAHERGAFGVPAFAAQGCVFWGNDRIPLLRDHLLRRQAGPAPALPLQTPRLALREFAPSDFEAVHHYARDPEVTRFLTWGPNTPADTRAFLERARRTAAQRPRPVYELAAVTREGDELVGGCSLFAHAPHAHEFEIGYCLRRDRWGRGYAGEIVAALVETAFGALDAHRVFARVDPENAASARVLERGGFRLEGCRRGSERVRGAWRDARIYARLADDPP